MSSDEEELYSNPFACGICGEKFSSANNLQIHVVNHTQNKKKFGTSTSSPSKGVKRRKEPDTSSNKKFKAVLTPAANSVLDLDGNIITINFVAPDGASIQSDNDGSPRRSKRTPKPKNYDTYQVYPPEGVSQNETDISTSNITLEDDAPQQMNNVTIINPPSKKNEQPDVQIFVVDEYYNVKEASTKSKIDVADSNVIEENADSEPLMDGVYICKTCHEEISAQDAIPHLMNFHDINPFKHISRRGKPPKQSTGAGNEKVPIRTHKTVKCPYCTRDFYKFHLQRHIDGVHLKKKEFTCQDENCKKKFVSEKESRQHYERTHLKLQAVNCPVCNKLITYEKNLKLHIDNFHGDPGTYKCSICGQSGFSNKVALNAHEAHHRIKRNVVCSTCKEGFPSMSSLHVHIGHSPGCDTALSAKQCDQCAYVAKSISRLESHKLQVHSSDRPFSCPFENCSSTFKIKYSLNLHVHKCHTGERTVMCDICERKFFYKAQLRSHMETHKTERNFKCTICSKTFVTKPQLSVHLNGVHSETLYTCSECNFTTSHRSSMKRHLQAVHNIKDMVYLLNEDADASKPTQETIETETIEVIQVEDKDGVFQTVQLQSDGQYMVVTETDNVQEATDQVTSEDQRAMLDAVAMLQGESSTETPTEAEVKSS